ncbi:hypothetical protein [Fulvimarina sp. MAC8]|uniref:hypothetical protein n=1 Tax=Fulvimarina sp. MAC8 TaxID=3162874 RepID=UPI0032EC7486
MSFDDDRELVELVSAALKSLSVASSNTKPVDFATVKREEASMARMVASLSASSPRRHPQPTRTDRE